MIDLLRNQLARTIGACVLLKGISLADRWEMKGPLLDHKNLHYRHTSNTASDMNLVLAN